MKQNNVTVVCMLLGAFGSSLVHPRPGSPAPVIVSGEAAGLTPSRGHVVDDFASHRVYTASEMKVRWAEHSADGGFAGLVRDVKRKGFVPIETSRWGYEGTLIDAGGRSVDVQFCVYDFFSPQAIRDKTWQTGSLVWGRVGTKAYKAYLVLPKRATSLSKALAESQEWFVGGDGKPQRAHSWGKRFNRCIRGGRHDVNVEGPLGVKFAIGADCKNSCLASIAVCGGAAAVLELASAGLGTPVLIAVFAGCAAVGCGQCLALCALAAL